MIVRWDADAGIPDRKAEHGLSSGFRFQFDLYRDFPLVRKFQGIAGQIDQDLSQTAGISPKTGWSLRLCRADKLQPFFMRFEGHHFSKLIKQFVQIKIKDFQIQLSGLNL